MGSTIIVGIGNPFLGDDGVGVVVAHRLHERCAGKAGVTVRECPVGGLRLAELLVGHDHAIIVDARIPGEDPPGTVREGGIEGCLDSWHASCAHDTNLPLALRTLAGLGEPLPADIRLIGIAAAHMDTFSEQLSPAVAAAADRVVDALAASLEQP
jgi:hydrogenase maturation protease